MTRHRRQRDAEWELRERMRAAHQAREHRARWDAQRQRERMVWVVHHLSYRCARCGAGSAGPVVENPGCPFREELVNWSRPDNLDACLRCGRLLCRRCGVYQFGLGWRCRCLCPDWSGRVAWPGG